MNSSTRRLIDPQLAPVLDIFPSINLDETSLAAQRLMASEIFSNTASTPLPVGLQRSEVRAPGPAGAPDVRMLVYQPGSSGGLMPAVLHIHGGGYVLGAPEMNDPGNRALANELGCVVVSVDYRLAPETPFPGPVEDCYAAMLWLWRSADELGVDRERIAVAGESAGGGLAAALALLVRDRGEMKLAFQQLAAPMLDDRTVVRTDVNVHVGEFIWRPDSNRFGWTALLGQEPGGADVSLYAAAARAEALAGLPPAYISVGALDLFLEEDLDYARRLLRAGVPVELHVFPGAFHGFELGAAIGAPMALTALATANAALRRALAPAA